MLFSGQTCQPLRDVITTSFDTLAERYERTMSRLEQITRSGYLVKVKWECEFDESVNVKQKPELLTHPIVHQSPLRTRDALYGGRNEAMCLYRKARENEIIQYVDVMSLLPYICKYIKFPIFHSVIHVGDACRDIEACLCMEGLIRCSIVPPDKLYQPVLPYRCNSKHMFCQCRTCIHAPQCGMYAYRG